MDGKGVCWKRGVCSAYIHLIAITYIQYIHTYIHKAQTHIHIHTYMSDIILAYVKRYAERERESGAERQGGRDYVIA